MREGLSSRSFAYPWCAASPASPAADSSVSLTPKQSAVLDSATGLSLAWTFEPDGETATLRVTLPFQGAWYEDRQALGTCGCDSLSSCVGRAVVSLWRLLACCRFGVGVTNTASMLNSLVLIAQFDASVTAAGRQLDGSPCTAAQYAISSRDADGVLLVRKRTSVANTAGMSLWRRVE